ncbi:hypothetical protein T439DRAFT_329637 [Meredithblackwellia eburnea MCA 4105]
MDPRFALSRAEEAKVLKEHQANALKLCEVDVQAFASCAQGRTISVTWSCRTQFKQMQACMAQYMTPDKIDEAKLHFLRERRTADAKLAAVKS